jgi:molybdopterin converting factor small subunit
MIRGKRCTVNTWRLKDTSKGEKRNMGSARIQDVSSKITVTIKYLVSVRDMTGRREEAESFPTGTSLGDVAGWLLRTYGITLPSPHLMSVLNGKGWNQYPEKLRTMIHDGDVICIFSLISGG